MHISNFQNDLAKVQFSEREQRIVNALQRQMNALGFDIPITTLTAIMSLVTTQKFYEIPFGDYLPVRVGNGAFSTNLLTYREYDSLVDDFTTGNIQTGNTNGRLASADAGIDSVNVHIQGWAKEIAWTLFELEYAAKSGNWDIVTAKERSRKKNWDLGIQKTAFLGQPGLGSSVCLGLLTQPDVTKNTTYLTTPINTLNGTPSQLTGFIQGLLNLYRANANRTAMPNRFVIPESDYLGLSGPSSPEFPIKSIMDLLQDTFRTMTKNADFQILPCAYADAANSSGILTQQTYVLFNSTEESIRMDIPVDYTNTMMNTLNGFQFQSAAFGQYTGAKAYRPAEMLYLAY